MIFKEIQKQGALLIQSTKKATAKTKEDQDEGYSITARQEWLVGAFIEAGLMEKALGSHIYDAEGLHYKLQDIRLSSFRRNIT